MAILDEQSRDGALYLLFDVLQELQGGFFKVVIDEGRQHFFYEDNTPHFPLYWTKEPFSYSD